MAGFNRRVFSTLSRRSRARKMELLREVVDLGSCGSVLDVGGHVDLYGLQLLETFPHKERLTVVNIDPGQLAPIHERHPEVHTQVADARRLEFPDQSFDLVYSNAVIEHVGSFEDQRAMAREVMRVGKRWFITTPNRWFPFEFHMRLPFVSWLPARWMRAVGKIRSYEHETGRYVAGQDRQLRLLSARELRELFPGSKVVPVRITVWPETFVVVGGRE